MNLKKQAISGIKWNGISMVAMTGLQFLTLAILARFLSPSDFGLMGMVMVVIGFAQVFADMGISNAIIHRQDTTLDQLSSLYWLNILAGIIVFLMMCASVPLVVAFYCEPRLGGLVHLTALIFLVVPLGQQFQVLMQKELLFNHLAKIEIVASIVNAVICITMAFYDFGVYALIWGQLASALVKVFVLVSWGWSQYRPRLYFKRYDLEGYWGFGLYQMGERTVNYLNSNLDYLLIGSILGAKSLGYYTLAYNLIIKPTSMINSVVTKVAFPVFSKMQNEKVRLKNGFIKVLKLLSLINFPMMLGLAVVAPVAVPVVFGEQWHPSIILVQILTMVGLLRSTGNPVGSLLLAKGRADIGFKWNLALTVTQIPGLYLGVKIGGAVGVAIAFAILMGIYFVLNYFILVRILLGNCLRDYINSMWPSLWMAGIMTIIVYMAGILLQSCPLQVILIIQVLCGIIIYFGLMIYVEKPLIVDVRNLVWKKNI